MGETELHSDLRSQASTPKYSGVFRKFSDESQHPSTRPDSRDRPLPQGGEGSNLESSLPSVTAATRRREQVACVRAIPTLCPSTDGQRLPP